MATDDNVVSDPKNKTAEARHQGDENSPEAKSGSAAQSSGENNNASTDSDNSVDKATEALEEKLKQAEKKASENWDELLRARAELDNTRKRMERDVENAHKYAVEKFVQGLLPVVDSLEMGLEAARKEDANIDTVKQGTELTLKMFSDCVTKFGMQRLDPKGEKFNPEYHQAMSIQESAEHEPDTVIAVMQKGYLLNGRLIRPAMVVVSRAASKAAAGEVQKTEENEKPDKSS